MSTVRTSQVIVGADTSLTGLGALRAAVAEARQRGCRLTVVRVRDAIAGERLQAPVAAGEAGMPGAPGQVHLAVQVADGRARQVIRDSIRLAMGQLPPVPVARVVAVGNPARVLVDLGRRDGDLLVVGSGDGRHWLHPWRRCVSRYCAAHARCPVLIVPRSRLDRATRRLIRGRTRLPHDPWKDFDTAGGEPASGSSHRGAGGGGP